MKKSIFLLLFISTLLLLLPVLTIAQINSNRATKTVSEQRNLKNIISYQGMINVPPDVYSKMQQESHMAANSIPGNLIKVQLWNVAYQPDPKKKWLHSNIAKTANQC